MRPRYTGPIIVISRNRGGAYIVAELNGSLYDRPLAAFRLIPYFARSHIHLPPLEDVSIGRLRELEHTTLEDTDEFFRQETPDPDPHDDDNED